MSVKYTFFMDRDHAITRLIELERLTVEQRRRNELEMLTNAAIEDRLETLNDLYHDGEGYENYWIREGI